MLPDLADPTRHLTPPLPQADLAENGFVGQFTLLDYFSPSYWLFELIKELANVDVLGELVSPLAGQWAEVSAYGDAVDKLSRCLDETGADLTRTTELLRPAWEGNAADAAFGYFGAAAQSLAAHCSMLAAVQAEYRGLAREMWRGGEAMKDIVEVMLDQALAAAVFAAIGTATAHSGVGAVAGYGLAALEVVKLLESFHRALLIVHAARATMQACISANEILTAQMTDIRPVPAIAAPYDHPAVS